MSARDLGRRLGRLEAAEAEAECEPPTMTEIARRALFAFARVEAGAIKPGSAEYEHTREVSGLLGVAWPHEPQPTRPHGEA